LSFEDAELNAIARDASTALQGIVLAVHDLRLGRELKHFLRELGLPIVSVADGYHLIEHLADAYLRDGPTLHPRLIVTDADLPGCHGLALLAGLEELNWDIPVILLAERTEHVIIGEAWKRGVTGIFLPPIDLDELVAFASLILDPTFGVSRQRSVVELDT
jgi:DNA-binding response OmpR family regulator